MKRKRIRLCCLVLTAMLCCAQAEAVEYVRYEAMFFHVFDTVIQIVGFTKDRETFDRIAGEAEAMFRRLHQIYDIYNEYDSIDNIWKVNRDAAGGPVPVEPELMDLLLYCRRMQPLTQGAVNIALGPVLSVWHAFREEAEASGSAAIPSMETLQAAAVHTDFNRIVLNETASTVFFEDAGARIDLGSIAKGYATELVAQWMLTTEMPSFVINAGGNVRAGNPPLDGRTHWTVGVQNPDGSGFLEKLYIANMSAVTSGDYQRFVLVDGIRYHHIISPFTLMPTEGIRSVTVVCEDSGLADLLSTAFFILPAEESMALAKTLSADILWLFTDGRIVRFEH